MFITDQEVLIQYTKFNPSYSRNHNWTQSSLNCSEPNGACVLETDHRSLRSVSIIPTNDRKEKVTSRSNSSPDRRLSERLWETHRPVVCPHWEEERAPTCCLSACWARSRACVCVCVLPVGIFNVTSAVLSDLPSYSHLFTRKTPFGWKKKKKLANPAAELKRFMCFHMSSPESAPQLVW